MPSPEYRDELHAAIAAARAAGDLIRLYAGRAEGVRDKSTHDIVTDADEEAQRLILARLAEDFPDYDVLAEEGDASQGPIAPEKPRWIVDPIDGTTNFAHGCPPYCVSIALQDAEGELVVGVVYEVALDELFTAVRGHGASLNGRPIRVSETAEMSRALVTTGFPFREFWYVDDFFKVLRLFIEGARGVRRPGSAAADLAYVASGRYDVFFEAGLEPWDVAAGIVLVREAGGRVTGLTDALDPLMGRQLTATNGRLHEAALELTRAFGDVHAEGRKVRLREGD
jgi:myo-inositol-1(or 4)-monophosphatase